MRKFSEWTLSYQLLTASAVGFLLAIGLCGAGFTIQGSGSALQQFEMGAGLLMLAAAILSFLAAIVVWLFKARG